MTDGAGRSILPRMSVQVSGDHPSMYLAEVIPVEVCPACNKITRVLRSGELADHWVEVLDIGEVYCDGSGLKPDESPEF